jgi:endonuclease III
MEEERKQKKDKFIDEITDKIVEFSNSPEEAVEISHKVYFIISQISILNFMKAEQFKNLAEILKRKKEKEETNYIG